MTRTIKCTGNITGEKAGDIIEQILNINIEDSIAEETIKDYEREPVYFILTSYGGEIQPALGILDAINSSITPIVVLGYGIIASAALTIFVGSELRGAGKNTTFLFHSVSLRSEGSPAELSCASDMSHHLNEKVIDIMVKNTKIKRKVLKEYVEKKQDWWFYRDEAIKNGVINLEV